ncbi:glutamyl-tRNA reductase [Desulfobacter hydrogenophilus]|uniref:Glutamyl-tRNA reductase n=1 Tax=Desulfobacter hydrogenophilus TaxID=2291 RepID=A0A328FHS9_9BACT|nr:glutamyl-tRNA reductase [Desulfobacter hydrogenophilus]NDY71544.1 glutamyl-tRNA reductase [Desulfobacter hydrogenophilus]QBH11927.1 glutamyl-tRNA reductase [Desulfobacter hydrogenophilus]RAM02567.1 glutamyl-tRNA reductase [Desulfobacter hydrogenophilus]
MPKIILIGASHKTAPVELREKLSFSQEQIETALEFIKQDSGIKEGLVFSTCNRLEFLYIPKNSDVNNIDRVDAVLAFISELKQLPVSEFKPSLYIHTDDDAIRHLFCVAASLDSMVVGEPQILGQVKKAYKTALRVGTTGVLLNRLMHKSFSVAKRVRKQTGIGDNAVSISYAAIELAHKIFADLATKSVMLIGAGEMAELAVEHLMTHQVEKIVVANRTFKNALELARKFNGQAVQYEERESVLADVDIIISSTGATDYVLTRDQVKGIMKKRQHKTLFFIDIAVPRDIDPRINKISNVYVYDIDDLRNIVETNISQRAQETIMAQRFVEEALLAFRRWLDELAVVPTIKAINRKMTDIVNLECEKTLAGLRHLSKDDVESIRRMTKAIASRAIHDPILFLRNTGDHRDDSLYLNIARQLFNLDIPDHNY